MVGRFTLTGSISAGGTVVMQKQYVDQHRVEYTRVFDGEGMMSGQWRNGCSSRTPVAIRSAALNRKEPQEFNDVVPRDYGNT